MKAARYLAIATALGLIGAGIWLDEPTGAMMNAVMLCLACMGVG